MAENDQQVEVEGPGGLKVKARGTDIIAVVVLVTGCVGVVLLWMHMQQAQADNAVIAQVQKEANSAVISALKEVASSNRELVGVQRVTNCLISKGQNERQLALAECERIAR